MSATLEKGLCECGCGGETRPHAYNNATKGWVKGEPRRFIHGHHRRKPARTCKVEGCDRPFHSEGYCGAHAYRVREHGSPLSEVPVREAQLPAERFAEKFRIIGETGCWEWTSIISKGGYGRFYFDGRQRQAHRVSYEMHNGPIPDGLDLDHLCRNRRCVNPRHLEPVTRRENLLRGDTIPARKAAQTRCIHGHEFTPENTHIATNGTRRCRACDREKARA